jgi:hypothetical protein
MRGIPTTIDATTIPTAIPEIVCDQTNQGATAATTYKKNSIASLMFPGAGTTTLFLSELIAWVAVAAAYMSYA